MYAAWVDWMWCRVGGIRGAENVNHWMWLLSFTAGKSRKAGRECDRAAVSMGTKMFPVVEDERDSRFL